MRLAHLHLSNPISYAYSLRLQEILLEKHFAYNSQALQSSSSRSIKSTPTLTQPQPTLLTFQANPVYTVGRRHLKSNPLSQAQVDFLTTNGDSLTKHSLSNATKLATFYASPRGGLLTYHAPGQLTAYLIVSLRTHAITPRCFIRLLENSVIRTCARHGVPNTLTTNDPGVWIGEQAGEQAAAATTTTTTTESKDRCFGDLNLKATSRKICAVGVHVSRGVTSHGVGLNISDAVIVPSSMANAYMLPPKKGENSQAAPGYLSWGFGRIVACGLEGKSITWLTNEGAEADLNPDTVAKSLADEVCIGLTKQGKIEVNGVDQVSDRDIVVEANLAPSVEI